MGRFKVPLSLIPPASLIMEAVALRDGAAKYGPFNWRLKKITASEYISAAQRHLLAWQDGEELAADSGIPHLAHAKACLAILIDAVSMGILVDDRPPKGAAPAMLEEWRQK